MIDEIARPFLGERLDAIEAPCARAEAARA